MYVVVRGTSTHGNPPASDSISCNYLCFDSRRYSAVGSGLCSPTRVRHVPDVNERGINPIIFHRQN